MSTSFNPNDGCVIVVDDPHGYVAPSKDVLIVGRIAHQHARAIALGMMQRVGFPEPMERKVAEPTIKGARRKEKRLHKGLRP